MHNKFLRTSSIAIFSLIALAAGKAWGMYNQDFNDGYAKNFQIKYRPNNGDKVDRVLNYGFTPGVVALILTCFNEKDEHEREILLRQPESNKAQAIENFYNPKQQQKLPVWVPPTPTTLAPKIGHDLITGEIVANIIRRATRKEIPTMLDVDYYTLSVEAVEEIWQRSFNTVIGSNQLVKHAADAYVLKAQVGQTGYSETNTRGHAGAAFGILWLGRVAKTAPGRAFNIFITPDLKLWHIDPSNGRVWPEDNWPLEEFDPKNLGFKHVII